MTQFSLKLVNNLTKYEFTLEDLEDKETSRLFYTFDITVPDGLVDGEYAYTLYDENHAVLATGLLQIGDYNPDNTTYEQNTIKENNGYITYGG